jgi:probable phosphoglycerate mutase
MTARVWLIRHGPTAWNAEGRLQGRADIPLSPEGRAAVTGWRLPPDLTGLPAFTSPLSRARETAAILLPGQHAAVEPRLTEMDYGDWEGTALASLRARLGPALAENEARGLDFTPPGGESPRAVQVRLRPLLAAWAESGGTRIAFCHKGVIRAVYAETAGWDMTGKPPHRLAWDAAHGFDLAAGGRPRIADLNRSLTAAEAES